MFRAVRSAATVLLAGAAWAIAVAPGLTDPPAAEPVKDRAAFFPNRVQQPLKGTAVGVLLYDGQPILSTEGRSGPPDQLVFSADGASYRWVYVPVFNKAQITNLRVPVGDKGETETYPSLDIARPGNVAAMGISQKYTLVEVEVNGGKGSPKNDSFVATKFKVLDATKAYPLRTADVVNQLKERYAAYLKEQGKAIDAAMAEQQKKSLKDAKATGPREQSDLMYVTWMTPTERLVVRFRTKITDGSYSYVGGGAFPRNPPALPLPPGRARIKPGFQMKVKVGTSFGVEFGIAYEVDKEGNVVRTQTLPFAAFEQRLQPPPQIGRPVPLPLPVPPIP